MNPPGNASIKSLLATDPPSPLRRGEGSVFRFMLPIRNFSPKPDGRELLGGAARQIKHPNLARPSEDFTRTLPTPPGWQRKRLCAENCRVNPSSPPPESSSPRIPKSPRAHQIAP